MLPMLPIASARLCRVKPSTSKRFLLGGSVPFGALGLVSLAAVACVRSMGVVDAPMMDAKAYASALALAGRPAEAAPPDDALDLPFRPGDRWIGSYTCRQGKSEMSILFEDVSRATGGDDESLHVEATFEFHFAGSSGYAPSDGAARMRGKYDPRSRRLRLVGEEWLEQPPGYALVNLAGSFSARGSGRHSSSYSGTVEGPGCTTFSARPEDASLDDEPSGKAGPRPIPPRSLPRPGP